MTSQARPAAATDAVAEREPFDVCGPLPEGTIVLEASAGTGKTFTIAALAARYVAEGHASLAELMLVTFGRMASTELRSRVRERLVALEAALAAGADVPAGDTVARLLADVGPAEREARHDRVLRALTDFDTATIATTHEFCLQMLDGLGVLGDREPQAVFVEQIDALTDDVATDLYLQRYASTGQAPMTHDEARRVARAAVASGTARLVPGPEDLVDADGRRSDAAERVAYAAAVRAEVERRKRAGRVFTYDDMLTRLRDTLADPRHGEVAAARLRARYQVVMVDEFQDTDPVQWDILRRAFAGHTTMVLIGDPKQAIYGFRGADVFSYLDAVSAAGRVATLGTSRRSDAALLAGLDSLMGGAALGEEDIVVRPVTAHHQHRRLLSAAEPGRATPVRLRVWPHPPDQEQVPRVDTLRPAIRDDLVADVVALLGSDLRLDLGEPGGPRPVCPADVAVLVRTNHSGEDVRQRLVAAGVPAVVHAARSVFASAAATEWVDLLVALEQPRQANVRRAALTCFFGWRVTELALASEQQLVELSQQVRWWRRVLAGRGVAALMETITVDQRVPERLLAQRGGVRRLTDLRHVADSLHAAATTRQLGVGALVEWLAERIAEAQREAGAEGSRRLETDDQAVTIVTVHRSKGLEYPIVYLPDAWDNNVRDKDEGAVLRLHEPVRAPEGLDPPAPGRVEGVLDVGGRAAPGRPQRYRRALQEEAGEDLRLLYVALTRAQCQVVTWWAPSHNTPASALQRFLHRPPQGLPAPAYPLTEGDPFSGRSLGPQVSLEQLERRARATWQAPRTPPAELVVRALDRPLDLRWRRTSYSALTAPAHGLDLAGPGVGSEAETSHEDDEAGVPAAVPTAEAQVEVPGAGSAWDDVSPMTNLPSGTDFGTAVHAVLEEVDPAAPDLPASIRAACAATLARTGSTSIGVDALAAGLLPAFLTPLGPLALDRRLADVPRRDQLAELGFELPLSGGDQPTREDLTLGDLVPLLRRHVPPGDPLAPYAERLAHPVLAEQSLRGYLTGSIDAVLRVRDDTGTPRYLVVDYKTNWLGPFDARPLTLRPYAPARLAEAMMAAHYPLQALLYAVAVHRMLRWRQSEYDPAVHLGGVLYLFVRGMAGPATPQIDGVPAGVFSWRPAARLVTDLSDLLAGDEVAP